MRKNKTLLLFLAFGMMGFAVNAQRISEPSPSTIPLHKIKLSLLGLTYQWEKPISRIAVFTAEAGVAGGFSFTMSKFYGSDFNYLVVPTAGLGYRNYYNLDRRSQKGKNTNNNTANFFSAELFGYGPTIFASHGGSSKHSSGISVNWGMQRNLSPKVNFEWQVGVAGQTDFGKVSVGPNFKLDFSFLACKDKK